MGVEKWQKRKIVSRLESWVDIMGHFASCKLPQVFFC